MLSNHFSFISKSCLMFLLACSIGLQPNISATTFPKDSTLPAPPKSSNCSHCHRPFRRLIKSLSHLEKEGFLSTTEKENALLALLKLDRSTFEHVTDPDLLASELLFKEKHLTRAQYEKIVDLLRTTYSN